MQTFIFVSALLNGIIAFVAGILVYRKNNQKLVNQAFAAFCFAIVAWSFGSFWSIVGENRELALLSFRILHIGAFLLAITNFHFVCAILGVAKKEKNWIRAGYFASILSIPFVSTKYFIAGLAPLGNFELWILPGIFYHFWITIWLIYFARSFHLLGKFLGKTNGIQKQQIKYIYLGEILLCLLLTLNFLATYLPTIPLYFNLLVSIQVVTFAYTIIRFRYLDVRLSILTVITKTAALIFALGIALGISYFTFFRKEELPVLFLFPIISIITYFAFSGFFNSCFFYHFVGLRHIDDFANAVNDFYKHKLFFKNLTELERTTRQIFHRKLGIHNPRIILFGEKNPAELIALVKFLKNAPSKYLVFAEIATPLPELTKLQKLGKVCFPLFSEMNKIIGFLIIGAKSHGTAYSQKELNTLATAAARISFSLRILNYNRDLRKEVDSKTHELKNKTQKLNISYRHLRELDEAKDAFFAVTAHDLRTPMTIIKGYGDFLDSEKFGRMNAKQRDFVKRIQKGSGEILGMINSILDINKLEAGRMEFNFVETEILSLIKEVLKNFEGQCLMKSIELNFENPENIQPKITTDPDKLKRVLVNLFGNAFKFTPGGGKITLRLTTRVEKFLRFEVVDTGVGIPKKEQHKIFNQFSQIKNYLQKNNEGTGLGLSIVKKIIGKLDGRVWVESRVNRGSNFIFELPFWFSPKK